MLIGMRPTARMGSSHQAFTPATWVSRAVRASPATTAAATIQSSPMMKSHQNSPKLFNQLITRTPQRRRPPRDGRAGRIPSHTAARPQGQRGSGQAVPRLIRATPVSYTHLRAHETVLDLVCRLLLE